MLAEGKRGLSAISKGSQAPAALGDYAELLITQCLPRYYNAAAAGLMYHFASASITAATANISPLPANTQAPGFAIANPPAPARTSSS